MISMPCRTFSFKQLFIRGGGVATNKKSRPLNYSPQQGERSCTANDKATQEGRNKWVLTGKNSGAFETLIC